MTKRERLELLIMKMAVSSGPSKQLDNVFQRFVEEISAASIEPEDIKDLNESEMIQGMMGVAYFAGFEEEPPSVNTIILTAKTMTSFHLNDLLKAEGIDILSDE